MEDIPTGAGIKALKELIDRFPAISLRKVLAGDVLTIQKLNLPNGEYVPSLRIELAGEPAIYSKALTTTLAKVEFFKLAKSIHLSMDGAAGLQFYISFDGKTKVRYTDEVKIERLIGVKEIWVASVAGTPTIGILTIE